MLNGDGKLICPEIRLENSSACNARCTICPREEMTRPQLIMGNEHFLYLLNQAKGLGATVASIFGFGEPMMDNHLPYKVELATGLGFETHVTTNASLLTVDTAKNLLEAGLKHIRFSVHGIGVETYEQVHKRLKWFEVTKNISNFIALNDKMGHPCMTHLTCIPMHDEPLWKIRSAFEHLVDYLEVWKPHNWAGAKRYRVGYALKLCSRPFSGPVQVQADGDVIPCCFLTNAEVVLGNTYKDRLVDILRGRDYENFQHAHNTDGWQWYPCGECDQKYEWIASPLLYSNRDPEKELNKLSTSKTQL